MDCANGQPNMKTHYHKLLASFAVGSALICFLGAPAPTHAQTNGGGFNGALVNAGSVQVPDGGASFLLLGLGCSGLALAARKRFKKS
jgi:hypothetical protein